MGELLNERQVTLAMRMVIVHLLEEIVEMSRLQRQLYQRLIQGESFPDYIVGDVEIHSGNGSRG